MSLLSKVSVSSLRSIALIGMLLAPWSGLASAAFSLPSFPFSTLSTSRSSMPAVTFSFPSQKPSSSFGIGAAAAIFDGSKRLKVSGKFRPRWVHSPATSVPVGVPLPLVGHAMLRGERQDVVLERDRPERQALQALVGTAPGARQRPILPLGDLERDPQADLRRHLQRPLPVAGASPGLGRPGNRRQRPIPARGQHAPTPPTT